MNMTTKVGCAAAFVLASLATGAAASAVNGTGVLTSNVIYGSGNANGSFTGVTVGNLELALRAHLRYDLGGHPQNVFNYDGNDTYAFDPALSLAPSNRSIFNFDFSINSDVADTTNSPSPTLSAYTYLINLAGPGLSLTSYDPFFTGNDNQLGYNSTASGSGLFNASTGTYNVAQNSGNLGFGFSSHPQMGGRYTISLSAFDQTNQQVASTSIHVQVVPLPASFPLLLGAFGAFGAFGGLAARLRRRRRRAA